jgi:hypothetical protein
MPFHCVGVALALLLAPGPILQATRTTLDLCSPRPRPALLANTSIQRNESPGAMPQESDSGFLSNTHRDWLTIVGTIGVSITILGFAGGIISIWIAKKQLTKTATATQAATEAALDALNQGRERYLHYVLHQANGFIHDEQRYIESKQWTFAALRLEDIATLITQSPLDGEDWNSLSDRLRQMGATFSKIQHPDKPLSASINSKWQDLLFDLLRMLNPLSRPFPSPVPDETNDN